CARSGYDSGYYTLGAFDFW
nr:immunoglobulin heavy chain junction region [Macaca mulatta]MOY19378.1 immunoglobulin heavy chain junction region [Macaca mulatta]MOY20206.1 immunoglobulin heavy chain junction region [Macaca mulatta]MOY20336.1 immunoglobulin heavy chain junction region [Macaca mulatta]